ncbi:translation initiation factor IF-3 [Stappia sp. GBMRC 2046]|uniref:Translation initiation factor IF-3 n=1 Tax=Stappia sediminis TaxID=2692190 RepID=A0A7X3S942_9HYPH|nr:translation initiation factor IF-3 [Stappia sediminis]
MRGAICVSPAFWSGYLARTASNRALPRKVERAGCRQPDYENSTLEEIATIRRPFRAPPPTKEGPRTNEEIRVREVQLIDHEGENRGIVPTEEALGMASEAGLDLVEIAPNSVPPVCKILDYGRYKYQAQKKAAEARKKQKTVEIKEIKMRPNIDTHDYEVKMRNMKRFFDDGDKVKVTLRFRGREMAHQDLGMALLNKVREETAEIAKVESYPKLEGRQMIMVLAPLGR